MEHLACVDVPALPLQVLLDRHPDWAEHPAAVVVQDRPQAPIAWVNERARDCGILPGMRYAAGLSLARELRAGVVEDHQVDQAVEQLLQQLRGFSPDVEPSREEPGVFWLDASGLHHLYPSLETWATEIRGELESRGLESNVAVGFTRFGSYAMARTGGGQVVLTDRDTEVHLARRVPLDRLEIDPRFRDALHKLGVTTVGDLVDLPPAGIRERFGEEAYRLHRMAAGDLWTPFRPVAASDPVTGKLLLTEPVQDTTQLLFHVKSLLHPLLRELGRRDRALIHLRIRFVQERGEDHEEVISPAAPTRSDAEITGLIRIRLEALRISAGVLEIHLEAGAVPSEQVQQRLLGEGCRRDLDAAARALGFVRAEHGHDAVVRAALRQGHLPEARFSWEPLHRPSPPHPRKQTRHPVVRRLYTRSRSIRKPPARTVLRWDGPHVFQGGWWARELHREYWFATTREGKVLWIYRDRKRERWVIQGVVE